MSKKEKLQKIENAVISALEDYDKGNVDIVKNEDGDIDIMYHSRHNSFDIQLNVCDSDELTESDIDKIAEEYDIGYVW